MVLLPRSAPAPRLLWSLDRRGWVVLAFEDVDGAKPTLPWRPSELRRVLEMVATMATALTPASPGLPTLRAFSSARGWSPSTGCGGPAGPDRLPRAGRPRDWMRGRPNFSSRGAGPSAPWCKLA
jgi:hypothetical protein